MVRASAHVRSSSGNLVDARTYTLESTHPSQMIDILAPWSSTPKKVCPPKRSPVGCPAKVASKGQGRKPAPEEEEVNLEWEIDRFANAFCSDVDGGIILVTSGIMIETIHGYRKIRIIDLLRAAVGWNERMMFLCDYMSTFEGIGPVVLAPGKSRLAKRELTLMRTELLAALTRKLLLDQGTTVLPAKCTNTRGSL